MFKRIILITLIIVFLLPVIASASTDTIVSGASGDEVASVQRRLRELGYFNYRITGRFSDLTEEAVRNFQTANGLGADGQIGEETLDALFSTSAVSAERNPDFKSVSGPVIKTPDEYGELLDWEKADSIMPVGTTIEIHDLYSEANFTFVRTGGVNNMMAEPVSLQETDEFVSMCGGEPTWEKRPVLIYHNGGVYAASIFCSLGGTDTMPDNGANGSTRIYFYKSASDLFALTDAEHDVSVLKAAGEI